MKIATITFNHAHNHGSMLQTYALQQFVLKIAEKNNISVDYIIIDFETDKQQQLYNIYRKDLSFKSIVKNVLSFYHYKSLKKRHDKFESFLKQYCNVTRHYSSQIELNNDVPKADIYISGSDQLWNVRAKDFSDVYFLPFVKAGKRISYAASFGPLKIDWNKYGKDKYTSLISKYDSVSVREEGSAKNIEYLIGRRPEIHLDPTFMLSATEWRNIQSSANYNNGDYILLYCLEPSKDQLNIAESISKKLSLPIVVLRYNNKNDWFNSFIHKYDAGPKDFLSYIDHAALVLSSSFHGTVFSLIYHKPFYVFNGMSDYRIATILKKIGMEERSIETFSDIENVNIDTLDGEKIEEFLKKERTRSEEYLIQAMTNL